MNTAILFGHARIDGIARVVEIVSSNKKTVMVRKAYKGMPYGRTFKRHIRKHGVRIHGLNVIRNDYM
jgi:hypothetical protein